MDDVEAGRLEDDRAVGSQAVSLHQERPVAAALFLDDEIRGQVSPGAQAQIGQGLEDEPDDGRLPLGIAGPAAVDPAVFDPRLEGLDLSGCRGHDVQVGIESQAAARSVPLDAARRLASPV